MATWDRRDRSRASVMASWDRLDPVQNASAEHKVAKPADLQKMTSVVLNNRPASSAVREPSP